MQQQEIKRAVYPSGLCAGSLVKEPINWCRENLPEACQTEFSPPSSPEGNFLGYFVWGVSELHVNKIPHNTLDSLVQKNKEVMGSLDRDTMARACMWLQPWIEALVEIECDFIT
jgi:hypothetical protein